MRKGVVSDNFTPLQCYPPAPRFNKIIIINKIITINMKKNTQQKNIQRRAEKKAVKALTPLFNKLFPNGIPAKK